MRFFKNNHFQAKSRHSFNEKNQLGAIESRNADHKEILEINYQTLIEFKPSWQSLSTTYGN